MSKQNTNPNMIGQLHQYLRPKNYQRLVVLNERQLNNRVISVKSVEIYGDYVRAIVQDECFTQQNEDGENVMNSVVSICLKK